MNEEVKKEEPEIHWPTPGEEYVDSNGRRLLVTRVNKVDKLERHVVGEIVKGDWKEPYATSLPIFQAIWRKP